MFNYRLSLILLSLTLFVLSPQAIQAQEPPPRDNVSCQIFPENNIWNTRIDDLPVHERSDAYLNNIGRTTYIHPAFGSGDWPVGSGKWIGMPYEVVDNSQAMVDINYTAWGHESDPGPMPIPADADIEQISDQHVIVINEDDCMLYELYAASPNPDGSWNAKSGAIFDLSSNELRTDGWTSADAAGMAIFPGMVRYEEIEAGYIGHAIRFSLRRTQDGYVWPARHEASRITDLNVLPMGGRMRLRADYDISGFHPHVQVILQAMKDYGLILADNGMDMHIFGAHDPRWSNSILRELRSVTLESFEVVNACSLQVDPDSGEARPNANQSPDCPQADVPVSNQAPTISTIANQSNMVGDSVSLAVSASDPEDDALTYSASNLPQGLSINSSTGRISGTVSQTAITQTTTVTVTDSGGQRDDTTFLWSITVPIVNTAPSVTNPGDQTATIDEAFTLTIEASDAEDDTLTFTSTGLPTGLSLDRATGIISGTPTVAGASPVQVTVSDGDLSRSVYFTITVDAPEPVNVAPTISNPGEQNAQVGLYFNMTVSASDADGDTLTYSTTGLPDGLFSDNYGNIAGTPTTVGTYPVTVTVTDTALNTASTNFTINVAEGVAPTPVPSLWVTVIGDQTNAVGDTVNLGVSATPAEIVASYSATGLPSGLSINASTGLISGTIQADAVGVSNVTVTATDITDETASTSFTWTVEAQSAPPSEPVDPAPPSDPTDADIEVQLRHGGTANNYQVVFHYRVVNTGTEPISNFGVRLYFTPNNAQVSEYRASIYWDQSGSAVITDALIDGDYGYFEVRYPNVTLAPGRYYEFHGDMYLADWSTRLNYSDDWWSQIGFNDNFTTTQHIPVTRGTTVLSGMPPSQPPSEPPAQPTVAPTMPPAQPTSAPPQPTTVPVQPTAVPPQPTTPPVAPPSDCGITVNVANSWNTGYVAQVTITNTGSSRINGWTMSVDLGAGSTMVNSWGMTTATQNGSVVTFTTNRNHWNGRIRSGRSISFGFHVQHDGTLVNPSNVTFNGISCS
ncbi:MAG: putative Ig domain-containing protein [Chloroflexota bacterium]